MTLDLGNCFHRDHGPARVVDQARAAEDAGYDEFWVIEDCFFTAGPSLAAAALTATESLSVGIGIMPAVARNTAVTAMEIATLAGLAPGRFHAGIGHGVQSWMAQMDERVASPLTMLAETLAAVGGLLDGERVSTSGRYVSLDEVALELPPATRPRVSAGVRGPKSLEISGRLADGTIMADFVNPTYLRWAAEQIGRGTGGSETGNPENPGSRPGGRPAHRVTVFATAAIGPDGEAMRAAVAPFLAEVCEQAPLSLRMAPFFDDLSSRAEQIGWPAATANMPAEWWHQIAAVGTPEDAAAYLNGLEEAGADAVALFPNPMDPLEDLTRTIGLLRGVGI